MKHYKAGQRIVGSDTHDIMFLRDVDLKIEKFGGGLKANWEIPGAEELYGFGDYDYHAQRNLVRATYQVLAGRWGVTMQLGEYLSLYMKLVPLKLTRFVVHVFSPGEEIFTLEGGLAVVARRDLVIMAEQYNDADGVSGYSTYLLDENLMTIDDWAYGGEGDTLDEAVQVLRWNIGRSAVLNKEPSGRYFEVKVLASGTLYKRIAKVLEESGCSNRYMLEEIVRQVGLALGGR